MARHVVRYSIAIKSKVSAKFNKTPRYIKLLFTDLLAGSLYLCHSIRGFIKDDKWCFS